MDWEEIFSFCTAQGYDYKEITWPKYQRLIRGYNKVLTDQFIHTRAICFYSIMPHMDQKDRVSMEEFWPLPSDPPKEEVSNEEILDFLSQVKTAYGR